MPSCGPFFIPVRGLENRATLKSPDRDVIVTICRFWSWTEHQERTHSGKIDSYISALISSEHPQTF